MTIFGPKFQAISDRGWKKQSGCTKEQWLNSLEGLEVFVVPFDLWVGQTQNGGLQQWQGNGYADPRSVMMVRSLLMQIGTPAADKALDVLDEFVGMESVNDVDEDDWEAWGDREHELTSRLYDLFDPLMVDVEGWVERSLQAA